MKQIPESEALLKAYFEEAIHQSLVDKLGLNDVSDVERYLADLLYGFIHYDQVFAIRNRQGVPVSSLVDMLAEGDIGVKADTFAREREVHKHIGDFVLFWSGFYPSFLERFRKPGSLDELIDFQEQARESYFICSTFDHEPFRDHASTFRKLSEEFEAFRIGLNLVRHQLPGFA